MKAEEFVIVALAAGFIRSGDPEAAGAMLEHLLATSPLPQEFVPGNSQEAAPATQQTNTKVRHGGAE